MNTTDITMTFDEAMTTPVEDLHMHTAWHAVKLIGAVKFNLRPHMSDPIALEQMGRMIVRINELAMCRAFTMEPRLPR